MATVEYGDIQVKDIADRADVALGTLHRYCPAPGPLPRSRTDVSNVMSAVLAEGLRGCATGSLSRAELRRRIARAADLAAGPDGTPASPSEDEM